MRLLYIDTCLVAPPPGHLPSSDSIGYGRTSSAAIQRGLQASGVELVPVSGDATDAGDATGAKATPASGPGEHRRAEWPAHVYAELARKAVAVRPSAIFVFHAFVAFPTVIRKILQDLRLNVPIIAYNHGSHWDPTDTYRTTVHPGLELADLANMCVVDRLLVVSEYMSRTLCHNVSRFNPALADRLRDKIRVVGLPIDMDLIDRYSGAAPSSRQTIVFNHAPVAAKRPEVFVRLARRALDRYDIRVLITRKFPTGSAGADAVAALARDFPRRVIIGNDMTLPDYYRSLWRSQIQVSTATHESLGVATLEAMYTRNCCILPRIGAYPEICDGDEAALYPPTFDALAERLGYFIEHPAEREAVAGRLARAVEKYSPSKVVHRLLQAIETAL